MGIRLRVRIRFSKILTNLRIFYNRSTWNLGPFTDQIIQKAIVVSANLSDLVDVLENIHVMSRISSPWFSQLQNMLRFGFGFGNSVVGLLIRIRNPIRFYFGVSPSLVHTNF